jgi:mannose/fructose/N-acetylgalactosamine-specific phosphotransferase system component IIC
MKKLMFAILSFFVGNIIIWLLLAFVLFIVVTMYTLFTWENPTFLIEYYNLNNFKIVNGIGVVVGFAFFLNTMADDNKYYK